tara:strand:- start:349 stop:1188 length:840 start_codon:yes stop_codon:yes gene_type:complete
MNKQDSNLIDSLISKAIREVFKSSELTGNDCFGSEEEKRYFYNEQKRKRIDLYRLLKNKIFLRKDFKDRNNSDIKILEIGPSEGIIARSLRDEGYNIKLLEYRKNEHQCIQEGKFYYPNLNVEYCEFNKDKFPYEDQSFDLVMSFGVIEHQEPPTCHFWEESTRVLKKGGYLFVDNPNPLNLRKRIFSLIGKNPNNEIDTWYKQKFFFTGHYREHTRNELIYCLTKNMKLVDSGYFDFILTSYMDSNPSYTKKIILQIYKLITRVLSSTKDTIYVLGKK